MSADKEEFVDYCLVPTGTQYITLGNGTNEEVLGVGSYQLRIKNGRDLFLQDVLYAPEILYNLSLIVVLLGLGYSFHFGGSDVNIYDHDMFLGSGLLDDGFFKLCLDVYNQNPSLALISSSSSIDDCDVWYKRLGHISQDRIAKLAREDLLGPLNKVRFTVCEPCLTSKAKRKFFDKAIW